jgi:hypothetical protein
MKNLKNLLVILGVITSFLGLLKPIATILLNEYIRNNKEFISLQNRVECIEKSIRLNQKKGNYL